MKSFKKEMDERIQSVKFSKYPDFGLPSQINLFEDMIEFSNNYYIDSDGVQQQKKRQSLWMLFFEAINRVPKF